MFAFDRGGDEEDEDGDGEGWEDTDEEGDVDSEFSDEDGERRAKEFLFMDEETKSRFTE